MRQRDRGRFPGTRRTGASESDERVEFVTRDGRDDSRPRGRRCTVDALGRRADDRVFVSARCERADGRRAEFSTTNRRPNTLTNSCRQNVAMNDRATRCARDRTRQRVSITVTVLVAHAVLARSVSAYKYTAGSYCYSTEACESGGSGTFDSNQRKMCELLSSTTKYCIVPKDPTDALSGCSRELLYHGWCDANKYVFGSGCLAKYKTTDSSACSHCNFDSYTTAYWSVGAPYPVHPGMVNQGLRACVLEYVKAQISAEFTAQGMTADANSLEELAKQEFPDEQMLDADDYNDQFKSYYLLDADFNALDAEMTDEPLDEVDGNLNESELTKTVDAKCSSSSDDQICNKLCAGDLGISLEYKIRIPKVCARIKVAGYKFKKCIKVPTTKFKIPNKCTNLCVTIPGYCQMEQALKSLEQFKSIKSLADLKDVCLNLGAPSDICNKLAEADAAFDAMTKWTKIGAATSLDALLDLKLLPSVLQTALDESIEALNSIAEGLEAKLRALVTDVFGNVAGTSSEIITLIENTVKASLFSSSGSSAALGAALEDRRIALIDDIHRGVLSAFQGEPMPTRSRRPLVPNLGAGPYCYHIPVLCDGESVYPMPWPKALENHTSSPGAFILNKPDLEFNLCGEITEFKVSEAVASKLLKAFGDMFEALFQALYAESGLKSVVEEVKSLKLFAASLSALGSSEQSFISADEHKEAFNRYMKLKERMKQMESTIVAELLKLSDTIHSPEVLRTSPARSSELSDVPSLGANTFQRIIDDFSDDLQEALKLMADSTSVKAEMSLNVKGDSSVHAKASVYKIGDFLDNSKFRNHFSGVHIIPLYPGLSAAVDYDVQLSLPYYAHIDSEASLAFTWDVTLPISVELSNSPNVGVGEVSVNMMPKWTGAAKSSAQLGASVAIQKVYIALCAGTACVGPRMRARQDVYVGADAWAYANCNSGYGVLEPKWTDGFSYSSSNKEKCLGSLSGAGGYLQIPKTSDIQAYVLFAPMPVTPGASAASTSASLLGSRFAGLGEDTDQCDAAPAGMILHNFTALIQNVISQGADNWITKDLFAVCTASGACPPLPDPQPYIRTASTGLYTYNALCCGDTASQRCNEAQVATYETFCAILCDSCVGCVAFDYQASTGMCGFSKSTLTKPKTGFTHFGHGTTTASKVSLGSTSHPSAASPAVAASLVASMVAAFAATILRRRRAVDARLPSVEYGSLK